MCILRKLQISLGKPARNNGPFAIKVLHARALNGSGGVTSGQTDVHQKKIGDTDTHIFQLFLGGVGGWWGGWLCFSRGMSPC